MKTQYQTYIANKNENFLATREIFNNILALNGLCDRDNVRHIQGVVREFYPQTFYHSALSLNAGRGVVAMVMAEMGFNVLACDMYGSSLSTLQQIAVRQELNISFNRGSIVVMESLNRKFDLIHDSEALTQMVSDADRVHFLEVIRNSLELNGKFVLSTLVQSRNFDPADSFETIRLDEQHVLWRETPACDLPEVVEMSGRYWTAQKKILPAAIVREELEAAGFRILSEDVEEVAGNNPAVMRMVLASTKGC